MADDDFPDGEAPDNLIPFPGVRPSPKLEEAWGRARDDANAKNRTSHRFPSPLDAIDEIMAQRLLPILPMPAGWVELAKRVQLRAGQCVGIVGPQGGGKTSFALQWAIAATAAGIPVLWVPLELDVAEVSERIAANMHGVHTMAVHLHWSRERIRHALATVADMWRFVDNYGDAERTVAAMRDAIALVKQTYRVPPFVVIDYLGKLASLEDNIRQATVRAAETLRAAAAAELCYVAMLAQPSRANNTVLTGKTEITASTDTIAVAADSSEVEGACAVMLALNVFKSDDAQELDAIVHVGKARNTGREGPTGFRFGKPGGTWRELDYLPANPMAIRAANEAAKKDKHRTAPAPNLKETARELNLARAGDADASRRAVILEALARHGALGMDPMAIRALPGVGKGFAVNAALQTLERSGVIERHSGRWRACAKIE